MKKLFAILMVLALTFSLAACGGGTKEEAAPAADSSIKVGYSCNNFNDTFQTYIVDAAKAAAEKQGITLDVQDAQEDVIKQQDQVKAMIEQGIQALIVIAVDTSAADPVTEAAKQAGIPLVYVNRNPFGDSQPPEGVYYIGTQEPEAGKMQAEYLKKIMPDGGNVAILQGLLTNEAAIKRTEGNEIGLADSNFKIVTKDVANWQRDQGMSVTENWLTAYGKDLNVILANNDEMALGAVAAIQAAGRTDIKVLGVDATPDARKAVADGTLAATVLQDPVGLGNGAIDIVKKAIDGTSQDSITWLPFTLITPDNVAEFQ